MEMELKTVSILLLVLLLPGCHGLPNPILSASASVPCASGDNSIPVTGTVTLTCDHSSSTVVTVQNDGMQDIKFKKGSNLVFALDFATTDLTMTTSDATNFPTSNLAAAIVNDNLEVTITSFPSSEISADWECEFGTATSGNTLDLTGFCSGNKATLAVSANQPCVSGTNSIPTSGTITLTCDPNTATVTSVLADASSAIKFFKGGSLVFELAAATSGSASITSADTTHFPTANLAVADVGGNLAVTVSSFPSDQLSADWSCAVTPGGSVTGEPGAASLDLTSFCSGTLNTVTFAHSHTTAGCTGTMTCSVGTPVATVQAAGGIVQFLKDDTVWFQIDPSDDSVKQNDGTTAYAGLTGSESTNDAIVTFSATTMFDATYDGSWTCRVVSSTTGTHNAVSTAGTVAISITTQCTNARFSYSESDKSLTCELSTDIDTVQAANGVINFYKGTTLTYVITTADVLNDGSNTAVPTTTATFAAPSTADSKKAVVTLVTYDASTVDAYWYCSVTGSDSGTYDSVSGAVPVTYSSGSHVTAHVMFVLAGLVAAFIVLKQ